MKFFFFFWQNKVKTCHMYKFILLSQIAYLSATAHTDNYHKKLEEIQQLKLVNQC